MDVGVRIAWELTLVDISFCVLLKKNAGSFVDAAEDDVLETVRVFRHLMPKGGF